MDLFAKSRRPAASAIACNVMIALARGRELGFRYPYCPVPVNATVSGLVRSESATLSVALRVNLALGAKLMLIVQFAPDASVDPQVLVCKKSPGFVPTSEMDVIVKVPGPTLPRVTFWLALVVPTNRDAKVRLVGLTETMVPVPLSETLRGLPGALSVIVRLALRTAATWGRNVILTVQEADAARVVPQVFDAIANSEALVPGDCDAADGQRGCPAVPDSYGLCR